jgi:hypothetical protein
MVAPTSTLKITDPKGSPEGDVKSKTKRKELVRARRFLASYYVFLPILLLYLLFKVFPPTPWPTGVPAKPVGETAVKSGATTPELTPEQKAKVNGALTPELTPEQKAKVNGALTPELTPEQKAKVDPALTQVLTPEQKAKLVESIPIYFFQGRIQVGTSLEERLLLLVIVAGALGSYIHSATSYSDFRGNRQFNSSWTLWYVLRPLIGVSLAMVVYFATRGGLLLLIVNGADASSASNVNPFGVAAVSGLTGMFSKQAADKLAEVFSTLFKSTGDENRNDSLVLAPVPVIKAIEPNKGTTEGGTELIITGTGFVAGAQVLIGGEPGTDVEVVNDTNIKVYTPSGEGTVDVTVMNADGQKGISVKGFTYTDGTVDSGLSSPLNDMGSPPTGDELPDPVD